MILSHDDILKADDLVTEEVPVPEWNGTVLVKALSGKERDAFEASCLQDRGKQGMVRNIANVHAKLAARCMVNEDGRRLFADNEINALGEKSSAALDRVFEKAAELSRLSDEDVEELAGNFGDAQTGDSTSG